MFLRGLKKREGGNKEGLPPVGGGDGGGERERERVVVEVAEIGCRADRRGSP